MGTCVGLWINNRKALIVTMEKGQEHHETYESYATRHIRFPGEPKGMTQSGDGDSKYREDLRTYFIEIRDIIKDAKSIFIFGPGKAKESLKKVLTGFGDLGERIVGVEPADKMTAKQIVAKVKERFFPQKPSDKAN